MSCVPFVRTSFTFSLIVGMTALIPFPQTAYGITLTFADAEGDDGVYPIALISPFDMSGPPTAAFHGFTAGADTGLLDTDHSGDGNYLVGYTDAPVIDFSTEVVVSSLFMFNELGNWDNGPDDQYLATLEGWRNGVLRFTYTAPTADWQWFEVTVGNARPINQLRFHNMAYVAIDDLTLNDAVIPEPASLTGMAGLMGVALLHRRRRAFRRACPPIHALRNAL